QRTMIELAHLPDRVVTGGRLAEATGSATMTVDFGDGSVTVVRYPGPDPFVVNRTTGVPDVQAFVALPAALRVLYAGARLARPLLRPPAVRRATTPVTWPCRAFAGRRAPSTGPRAPCSRSRGARSRGTPLPACRRPPAPTAPTSCSRSRA